MSLTVSGDRTFGDGGLRRSSLPSGDAKPHSDPSRLVPRRPNPQLGLALLTNGLCDGTDEEHRGHPDQSSDPRRLGDGLGVLARAFAFRFGRKDAEAGRECRGRGEVALDGSGRIRIASRGATPVDPELSPA